MELYEIIILSIVQGITEWLPISSSGHLVIFQEFFNMQVPIYFDILLHFATLIVIFLVFYKEIIKMLKAVINLDFKSEYGKLFLLLIIGSIPIAIVGLVFKDFLLSLFTNVKVIGVGLLTTALLLISTKFVSGNKKLSTFPAIIIGIAQSLAIIPGISRSGSTISTSLLLGIRKELAIKFSFLLSVPAIIGATILEYTPTAITKEALLGVLLTIIVGYIALKLTIRLVLNEKFHYFSIYCFILGILLLLI